MRMFENLWKRVLFFALREFVYLREILPRNNFQQSFTPKCILHSKYVFSTREFEKISSKSFDTRYLSRVERSYEIHDLKNSTTCRILESFPFKRERRILDARKKRKKNISFRRSFQRSFQLLGFAANLVSIPVFSVESFAKRDSYGSSKLTTNSRWILVWGSIHFSNIKPSRFVTESVHHSKSP